MKNSCILLRWHVFTNVYPLGGRQETLEGSELLRSIMSRIQAGKLPGCCLRNSPFMVNNFDAKVAILGIMENNRVGRAWRQTRWWVLRAVAH